MVIVAITALGEAKVLEGSALGLARIPDLACASAPVLLPDFQTHKLL